MVTVVTPARRRRGLINCNAGTNTIPRFRPQSVWNSHSGEYGVSRISGTIQDGRGVQDVKGVKDVKTSRMSSRLGIALLALFTSLTLFTSFPRAAHQSQAPTFRSRIDLVELDVSVLDKDRKPVRGLTRADFTVFEDGKPQDIKIFEPVDVPDAQPPQVEWMRDVTPDVATNETKVTRLWVLAIDDAMIPQEPRIIADSKKIVRDIVDRFGPEDLATIVFTTDSRQAQDFTNDRTKLMATLDKFFPGNAAWTGGPPGPVRVDPDWLFQTGAILTLRNIMDALVAVPHSRKALIWVTPGIPQDFIIVPQKAPSGGADNPTMAGPMAQRRIIELAKEVFELSRRANVPIYPIDPCGLSGLAFYVSSRHGSPPSPGAAMEFIMTTALNTGGHAIVNTNDFTPGINSIFQENGSYYLVGYNPTNANADGRPRQINVKVNRKDVEVRTKSEYFAPKPGDGPPKNASETLVRATAAPVPVSELPLRATVAPFAIPGKTRLAAVAIALGVRQPVPDAAATERVTVATELRVTAFTTEGDNKGTQRSTAKVVLRAGAKGDADYEALSRLDLPPGRYRLRLAAHLESAAKTGTVMVDVIVPDFNREPASISGVVISATPGRPSAPRDLFSDVLPVTPTAQRLFEKSDRASALFDLYQIASKPMFPANVAVRIIDAQGVVVIKDFQTLGVDRFVAAPVPAASPTAPTIGGTKSIPAVSPRTRVDAALAILRTAEFRYPLPLDRLTTGRYLMTFEVMVGTVGLRRDVQFEVR